MRLAGGAWFSFATDSTRRPSNLSRILTEGSPIVLLQQSNLHKCDWLSPNAITAAMGITPKQVPTYLSLTAASKTRALYRGQAVRLIKLYGNIDSIFENLAKVSSERIRQKLRENEGAIRDRFEKSKVEAVQNLPCGDFQTSSPADLDTESNRQFLREYGFHSLVRLLGDPLNSPF